MTVYYNEFDPKAAAWLRVLINFGHLPDGIVDERSIEDVTPNDLKGFSQCHFFAGIGGWPLALSLAGWPTDRPVWTGSCPCQPFSAAGKGKGADDERHLWPAWQWLIGECRPAIVFGEQVASKAGREWFGTVQTDLQNMGYAAAAADICAAGIGAPHWRQRLWFVGLQHAEGNRWEQGRAEPIGRGASGGREFGELADASKLGRLGGRSGQEGVEPGSVERSERPRDVGRVAESDGGHTSAEREQRGGQQRFEPPHGGVGGMGNTSSERLQGRGGPIGGDERQDGQAVARGSSVGVGNAFGRRRQSQPENLREYGDRVGAGRREQVGRVETSGYVPSEAVNIGPFASAINGFWGNADWLLCTDGKWRPVEPGTFPLAHGLPDRVGLLRGYGNAIVPQVAQAFIESVMEIA